MAISKIRHCSICKQPELSCRCELGDICSAIKVDDVFDSNLRAANRLVVQRTYTCTVIEVDNCCNETEVEKEICAPVVTEIPIPDPPDPVPAPLVNATKFCDANSIIFIRLEELDTDGMTVVNTIDIDLSGNPFVATDPVVEGDCPIQVAACILCLSRTFVDAPDDPTRTFISQIDVTTGIAIVLREYNDQIDVPSVEGMDALSFDSDQLIARFYDRDENDNEIRTLTMEIPDQSIVKNDDILPFRQTHATNPPTVPVGSVYNPADQLDYILVHIDDFYSIRNDVLVTDPSLFPSLTAFTAKGFALNPDFVVDITLNDLGEFVTIGVNGELNILNMTTGALTLIITLTLPPGVGWNGTLVFAGGRYYTSASLINDNTATVLIEFDPGLMVQTNIPLVGLPAGGGVLNSNAPQDFAALDQCYPPTQEDFVFAVSFTDHDGGDPTQTIAWVSRINIHTGVAELLQQVQTPIPNVSNAPQAAMYDIDTDTLRYLNHWFIGQQQEYLSQSPPSAVPVQLGFLDFNAITGVPNSLVLGGAHNPIDGLDYFVIRHIDTSEMGLVSVDPTNITTTNYFGVITSFVHDALAGIAFDNLGNLFYGWESAGDFFFRQVDFIADTFTSIGSILGTGGSFLGGMVWQDGFLYAATGNLSSNTQSFIGELRISDGRLRYIRVTGLPEQPPGGQVFEGNTINDLAPTLF